MTGFSVTVKADCLRHTDKFSQVWIDYILVQDGELFCTNKTCPSEAEGSAAARQQTPHVACGNLSSSTQEFPAFLMCDISFLSGHTAEPHSCCVPVSALGHRGDTLPARWTGFQHWPVTTEEANFIFVPQLIHSRT